MYEDGGGSLYVVVTRGTRLSGYALSACQAPDWLDETLAMLYECSSRALDNTLSAMWETDWLSGEIMSEGDIDLLLAGTVANHDQVSTIVSVTATDDPCGNAAQRAMRY